MINIFSAQTNFLSVIYSLFLRQIKVDREKMQQFAHKIFESPFKMFQAVLGKLVGQYCICRRREYHRQKPDCQRFESKLGLHFHTRPNIPKVQTQSKMASGHK